MKKDAQEVENGVGKGKQVVNPSYKAPTLIERELAKKGVPHTQNEVEDAIDALYAAYDGDGTVPIREAFTQQCLNIEVGETVLTMKRDPFTKGKLDKGGIAAVCAGCVLAVAIIGGGIWWSVASQPQNGYDTEGTVISETETQNTADDTESDKTEMADKAKDESAKTDGQATGNAAQHENDSASEPNGNSSNPSTGNGGFPSTTKPSGGSTAGSGTSPQTQQPSHTHSWVTVTATIHHDAQYETIHHDAQYETIHHDAVIQERTICNKCGADITENVDAHMKTNVMNGCGSYSVKSVVIQQAYDEQVLVSNAWDETVTTGYRCSTCGATK